MGQQTTTDPEADSEVGDVTLKTTDFPFKYDPGVHDRPKVLSGLVLDCELNRLNENGVPEKAIDSALSGLNEEIGSHETAVSGVFEIVSTDGTEVSYSIEYEETEDGGR